MDIIVRKEFAKTLSQIQTGDKIWIVSTVKEVPKHIFDMAIRLSELDFINFVRISHEELSASSENYPKRPKEPVVNMNHLTATGIQIYFDMNLQYIDMYDINYIEKDNGSKMVDALLKDYPKDWSINVFMDFSGGFFKAMSKKYNKIEWTF